MKLTGTLLFKNSCVGIGRIPAYHTSVGRRSILTGGVARIMVSLLLN